MSELYVIAEAAQGYEGDATLAKLLVTAAAVSGANAVKFQVVFAEDLCEPGYEYHELFRKLEMSADAWRGIRELAGEKGLDFLVDVFGQRAVRVAESIDVDAVKLHSTTFFDDDLTRSVLQLGKPTYVSVAGVAAEEIAEFIEKYRARASQKVVLLHGFQAEPTPLDRTNLARIRELREMTGLEVGFMDHTDGDGADTVSLSAMALALGVNVFEKHITLDRSLRLEDYVSGLAPAQFTDYVTALRRLSQAMGDPSLVLHDDEIKYRKKALKRVVAARELDAGATIAEGDIKMSRPAEARGCYRPEQVVGKTLKRAVRAGTPIAPEDV